MGAFELIYFYILTIDKIFKICCHRNGEEVGRARNDSKAKKWQKNKTSL
jgi:hypothetical protein